MVRGGGNARGRERGDAWRGGEHQVRRAQSAARVLQRREARAQQASRERSAARHAEEREERAHSERRRVRPRRAGDLPLRASEPARWDAPHPIRRHPRACRHLPRRCMPRVLHTAVFGLYNRPGIGLFEHVNTRLKGMCELVGDQYYT